MIDKQSQSKSRWFYSNSLRSLFHPFLISSAERALFSRGLNKINFVKVLYYLLISLCVLSSINNLYSSPYINPKISYENNSLTTTTQKLTKVKPYIAKGQQITFVTNAGIPLSTMDFPNLLTYYQSQFALAPTILVSDKFVSKLVIGFFSKIPNATFYESYKLSDRLKFDDGVELLRHNN